MCWKQYLKEHQARQILRSEKYKKITENNLKQGEASDNLSNTIMNMYIFSGSSILSILLLAFNGISGHPIGDRRSVATSDSDIASIEAIPHAPDECSPSRQAESNNIHDIACLLDMFRSYQLDFTLNCINDRIFYGDSLPELYRALVETLSLFENTNLAVQSFNESVCTLKNIVQPDLNTIVRNYCDCEENCSSYQPVESTTSHNEQCLLLNLLTTLGKLQIHLGGQHVTCRRANNAQKLALINFRENVHDYFNLITPTDTIFETIGLLPPIPCGYRGVNMSDHIKSLYTIVPQLSNLTSCEASSIAGNLSEVILPIIRPLVDLSFGEGYFDQAINSSTPLASVATLTEQEKAVCLMYRVKATYKRFMDIFRDRDIISESNFCIQYSS